MSTCAENESEERAANGNVGADNNASTYKLPKRDLYIERQANNASLNKQNPHSSTASPRDMRTLCNLLNVDTQNMQSPMYKSEENPEKRGQQGAGNNGQEESNSLNENDTRQKLSEEFLIKTIIDKLN